MELAHHASGVAMGGVDDDGVNASVDKSLGTLQGVDGNAYASRHAKTALVVLASVWLVLCLGDVLICYQANEMVVAIHDRKFLNLVLLQNLRGIGKIGLLVSGDKVLLGHHVVNEAIHVALETQVAVGDDAHEMILAIHHGDATDMILGHHPESVLHGLSATYGHGVVDHAVFSTLDDSHLSSLLVDRHILVDYANTTLTSDGNGHRRLRDSVHGSRHEWDVELNVSREAGLKAYLFWQYIGISRDK